MTDDHAREALQVKLALMQQKGVAITSDNCPSREDKPELTDGGIGFKLRRLRVRDRGHDDQDRIRAERAKNG